MTAPLARSISSGRWLLAGLVGAAAGAAPVAAADYLDTTRPASIVVGPPLGYASQGRLGPHRLGRTSIALPAQPRELWRHELPGSLDFPPLVDAAGAVLAVTGNRRVVRVGADGTQRWQVTLGRSAGALPPLLTSDGALAVVCADGRVRRVGPAGNVRTGPLLSVQSRKVHASPLALEDGGLVVATERQILRLDAQDQPVARAGLSDRPVGGVLRWGEDLLVTLEDGTVLGWRPPGLPRILAKLPGSPTGGGALIGPSLLAVVLDRTSVVTVHLRSGQMRILAGATATGRRFDGPVVLDQLGRVVVASVVGELLVFDRRGAAVRRLALENEALIFSADGGAPLPSIFHKVEIEPSPPLIIDRAGRVAFVRASGRVGVVDGGEGGDPLRVASPRFCANPLAILPAGQGRMLVACQNGSLGMFTDG